MSVRRRLTCSKTQVNALCGGWILALGTVLVWWNLQSGYPTRAQVVAALMGLGAVIYLADIVSTLYRGETGA
jgi:hypothetical protein